jgi:hypothetical protein
MAKGSEFERQLSKAFSLWFTNGKRDDIFYRTAASGARATQRMKKQMTTADSAGDMCAMDPIGKPLTAVALFEFKRGYGGSGKKKGSKKKYSEEIEILPILDNPASQSKMPILLRWFYKAECERAAHKRLFTFIIFRRNRKVAIISMTRETFAVIKHRLYLRYDIIDIDPNPVVKLQYKKLELVLIRLDDFFKWCNPNIFKVRILRRRKRG